MPFVGRLQAPPPPPLPGPPPKTSQRLRLALSRGEETVRLDAGGWSLAYSRIEGLDTPATELLQQRAAGQYGSFAVGVDVPAREIFLPMRLGRSSLTTLLNTRQRFNRIVAPYGETPTRLTVTRPDGQTRWIEGWRDGQGQIWRPGSWEPWQASQQLGLVLVCPDPWWRGGQTVQVWRLATPVDFFPITPARLSPSQILGDPIAVDVQGDVATWPRWTLTGPFTEITATHLDSGRSWTLSASVAVGEQVTVDTDPRIAATYLPVVGPGGGDWFDRVEPPFDLWGLPPGRQSIQIAVTGADQNTAVRVEIPHLWETA